MVIHCMFGLNRLHLLFFGYHQVFFPLSIPLAVNINNNNNVTLWSYVLKYDIQYETYPFTINSLKGAADVPMNTGANPLLLMGHIVLK